MSDNNNNASGGLSFCGALTIVFIVLKLTGVIDWSWVWVLSPTWISIAVVLIILLVVSINGDWWFK